MNHNLIQIILQRLLQRQHCVSAVKLLTINSSIFYLYEAITQNHIINYIFTQIDIHRDIRKENLLIVNNLTTEKLIPLLKNYLHGEKFFIYNSGLIIDRKKSNNFFNHAIYGTNGLYFKLMYLMLYNKMKFSTIKKILKKYLDFTRYTFAQIFIKNYTIFDKYNYLPQFPHKQQFYFKWPKLMKYLTGQILGKYYSHVTIKFFRDIKIENMKSIIMDWQMENLTILDQIGKPPAINF